MKKSLFTLVVLFICSLLSAQFVVWHNGEIMYQSDINDVDSITLYDLDHPSEDKPEVVPFVLPNVPNPGQGLTTVVLYVPEDTPEGCYAVGTVNGWGEKNTEMKFAEVENADSKRWVSYTFDYAADMEIKVCAIPSDPSVAPGWSYQWAKNIDPLNDLEEDNVVILEGEGTLQLENFGEPKLVTLADNGVVYIHVKAWATTPVIEAKVTETAWINHPWNGGAWSYQEMTKVAEGVFEYEGYFGSHGVNIATNAIGGSTNWYPMETINFVDDVATGDYVKFTFVSEKMTIGTVTVELLEKATPVEPEEPKETKDITVKAKVPATWTNEITAWVWWPTGANGKEVVPTKEGDWYVVTENCAELNIIFKNGEGWNGYANQTEDITGVTEKTCYQLYQEGEAKATATAVDCE